MARQVVEACAKLDIRELRRRGWLLGWRFLTWKASDGSKVASVSYVGRADALELSYQAAGVPTSYTVQVVRTSCHYGGSRPWFTCPGAGCGRRCAVLYVMSRYFLCRQCNGLAYRTQHERADGRLLVKADRLWRRAGCEWGGEGEKPKGMHWRTFAQLAARAEAAYAASWNTPRIARLLGCPAT